MQLATQYQACGPSKLAVNKCLSFMLGHRTKFLGRSANSKAIPASFEVGVTGWRGADDFRGSVTAPGSPWVPSAILNSGPCSVPFPCNVSLVLYLSHLGQTLLPNVLNKWYSKGKRLPILFYFIN